MALFRDEAERFPLDERHEKLADRQVEISARLKVIGWAKALDDTDEPERVALRAESDRITEMRRSNSTINPKDISTKQLREKILQSLGMGSGNSWTKTDAIVTNTARMFGYDTFSHPGTGYDSKVKRTLDAMAKEGVIRKTSGNDRVERADGQLLHTTYRSATWALPEVADRVHEQFTQARETQSRQVSAWEDRKDKITAWASEHDIQVDFSNGSVIVDPDTFERILIKLADTMVGGAV